MSNIFGAATAGSKSLRPGDNIFGSQRVMQQQEVPKRERQNIVFKALDVASAGGYAVNNVLKDMVDGGDFTPLASFYKGLTLKEKTIFSEVLGEIGWNPDSKKGKVAKAVVGFAGDVLLDPITYLSAGLSAKGRAALLAAKKTGAAKWVKGIGWADEAGKAIDAFNHFDKATKVKIGSDMHKMLKAKRAQKASGLFGGIDATEDIGQAMLTFFGKPIPGTEKIDKAFMALRGTSTKVRQFGGIEGATKAISKIMPEFAKGALGKADDAIQKITRIDHKLDFFARYFSKAMRHSTQSPVGHMTKRLIDRNANMAKRSAEALSIQVANLVGDSIEDVSKSFIKKMSLADNALKSAKLSPARKKLIEKARKRAELDSGKWMRLVQSGEYVDMLEHGIPLIEAGFDNEAVRIMQKTHDQLEKIWKVTHGGAMGKKDLRHMTRSLEKSGDVHKDFIQEFRKFGSKHRIDLIGVKNLKGDALRPGLGGLTLDEVVLNLETGNVFTSKPVFTLEGWQARNLIEDGVLKTGDGAIGTLGFLGEVTDTGAKIIHGKLPGIEAYGDFHLVGKKVFLAKTGGRFPVGAVDLNVIDSFRKGEAALGQTFEASIKQINENMGHRLFSTDVRKLLSKKTFQVRETAALDKYVRGMTKNLSLRSDKHIKHATGEYATKIGVKDGQNLTRVDKFTLNYFPNLKNQFFTPENARQIDEAVKLFYDGETIHSFVAGFDKLQNTWKAIVTTMNAPFHVRNFVSNVYQMHAAGLYISDPAFWKHMKKAMTLTPPMGGRNAMLKMTTADKKLLKEFETAGLSSVGWITGDIDKNVMHAMFEKPKGLFRKAEKVGRAVGEWVEGTTKFALFSAQREKGYSVKEASDFVKKYMFDYGDLTRFEKTWMKRMIPFYTFSRKSIPMHLETLIKTPARQAAVIKFKNNIEFLAGEDTHGHILPEWASDNLPVFIGTKNGKQRYINLAGMMPVADLRRLSPDVGFRSMIEMFSPVIKTPAEQLLNYNFFFGSKITGATDKSMLKGWFTPEQDYFHTKIGGRMAHLARIFRPINELEKLVSFVMPDKIRGQAKYDTQEKMWRSIIGSITYGETSQELIKRFSRGTKKEEANLIRQINYVRDQMKKYPQTREQGIKDIQMMRQMLAKAKQASAKERQEALKRIFI